MERDEEGVVHRILSLWAAPEHPEGKGMEGGTVPLQQQAEAGGVPGSRGEHQISITPGMRFHA
jgi:hypothetical protein